MLLAIPAEFKTYAHKEESTIFFQYLSHFGLAKLDNSQAIIYTDPNFHVKFNNNSHLDQNIMATLQNFKLAQRKGIAGLYNKLDHYHHHHHYQLVLRLL